MLKNFNEEFDRLIEWDAAKYKNLTRCSTHFMIPGKGAWKMCWPVYTPSWVFHFTASHSTSTNWKSKEKENINLQLQCHHFHLSINSTKQQFCMLGWEVPLKNKIGIKRTKSYLTHLNKWDQILGRKLQIQ